MADIALAFFWHQHQPYYPDDLTGENPMPWVRLHGVKDYYGMALHLLEYPEMRCTINLVPSLLVQLLAYTERGATDRLLQVSRVPADALSEDDCLLLLDSFFMANPDQMILPYPRYGDLYHRRAAGRSTAREALRRFQVRDFRDLQVWFNLTWIHPIAFEADPDLRELIAKSRNFTEAEKNLVLDKQLAILRQIIPLHRKLAESGQVELTTTPFYHPILPLLLDKKLAREAMPDVKLPRYSGGYPEDAEWHVGQAVRQHAELFGQAPRGMWPAEGSVCQIMLPLLARHGIRWIATDEEVLSASTEGFVSRDAKGHVRHPERLYRAYKAGEPGQELSIVFRDHALSDMIGFHYQRSDPVAGANDFVGHLQAIGKAIPTSEGPALVSVILDGENCWEHYPGGGVAFLRKLYERCTRTPEIRPVCIGEYLERHPATGALTHLFAGSWISHNFAIWVGHEEDNTAWDALHNAREHLRQRERESMLQDGQVPDDRSTTSLARAEAIRRAWREIYIAEGSDWFWWFGDDHSSAQDALFDYLFRKHLQNVYLLLGDPPPSELSRPIRRRIQRAMHSMPRAFLDVKVDGRQTFFEWIAAGRYTCQNERGTMAMVTQGPLKDVFFGFTLEKLLIRIDCHGPARKAVADHDALRIGFLEPVGREVLVRHPGSAHQTIELLHRGEKVAGTDIAMGMDQIIELAIPFERLGVALDGPIQFFVELLQGRQSRDRAPREGAISLTRPSPDFERIMWNV